MGGGIGELGAAGSGGTAGGNLDGARHTAHMDGLGDAVGGAISTGIGRAVDAFGQALNGVGNAFVTVPGGAAWLVVLAVVVGGAWMLARR